MRVSEPVRIVRRYRCMRREFRIVRRSRRGEGMTKGRLYALISANSIRIQHTAPRASTVAAVCDRRSFYP